MHNDRTSRVGLTPSPTCRPGKVVSRKGDVAKDGNQGVHSQSDRQPSNLEGFFVSKSAIPLETIAAYRATHYRVIDQIPFVLKIGRPSQHLQRLFREYDLHSAAFLTAWNPFSHPTSEADNRAAQARLENDIFQNSLPVIAGEGVDPTGEWPGEPSVLALGLSLEAASSLGVQYQQNAIVWADQDIKPQLILLR